MSEILRTRMIRPSTRKVSSTSYKIDTKSVGLNDTLRVEIKHESEPGRWVFIFAGREINNRDSISFRVVEEKGKMNINWGSLQPQNSAQKSATIASDRKTVKPGQESKTKPPSNNRKTSFSPVISEGCTVLVLGTMPGEQSLTQQQYYAHPRNRFWTVMASIIGEPAPAIYKERTQWLVKNRVALWDVAYQCERSGSLDSNIRDEEPNDLERLMKRYPSIRAIAFNGAKAEAMYSHFFVALTEVEYYSLPSTSPANTVSLTNIESRWSVLKPYFKGGEK